MPLNKEAKPAFFVDLGTIWAIFLCLFFQSQLQTRFIKLQFLINFKVGKAVLNSFFLLLK